MQLRSESTRNNRAALAFTISASHMKPAFSILRQLHQRLHSAAIMTTSSVGASDYQSAQPLEKRQKNIRTRTGCLTCRKRKRKCDDKQPLCGWCKKKNRACEWFVRPVFRDENAHHIGNNHPSMKWAAKQRPGGYRIVNVTAEVSGEYNNLSSPRRDHDDENDESQTSFFSSPQDSSTNVDPRDATNTRDSDDVPLEQAPSTESFGDAAVTPSGGSLAAVESPMLSRVPVFPTTHRQTESAVENLLYFSQRGGDSNMHPRSMDMAVQPMPVDSVTTHLEHGQPHIPNGTLHEDGLFLPGSTYQELHTTLREHLIQEVRANAPTRAIGPRNDNTGSTNEQAQTQERHKNLECATNQQATVSGLVVDQNTLSQKEECELWRNWFVEVAPWLDIFDTDRHFQYTLPTMAPDHDHLRCSILALSARQRELKHKTQPAARSLALYQEAIHLLLPNLASRSTAVIASCVILCVLEMVSCSPKAWQRHLDGCASLMEAVGINGFVGGIDQALFWCFARMDVCGGLISPVTTLIPVSQWASRVSLSDDVAMFESAVNFANWANYAVYLTAQVLDLLAPFSETLQVPNSSDPTFCTRWKKLWRCICDWSKDRPAELLPVMTTPSSDVSPFPTIIFSNVAAISGNQMHHTASVLMLQNQPPNLQLPEEFRSVLWHARRICAISMSNDHHGAWTNAVQPLWVAGRCMSHPTEHKAILDILERIEKECGWGTKWRQDDLKAFWGDLKN